MRSFILLLSALFAMAGCATGSKNSSPSNEYSSEGAIMAAVAKETLRAESLAKTCKKKYAAIPADLETCRQRYEEVYVNGRALSDNAADMIVTRTWNDDRIESERRSLDDSMVHLREASGTSTAGANVVALAGPIIDILVKAFDAWKTRNDAARKSLADTIKAHAWTKWEDIKAPS